MKILLANSYFLERDGNEQKIMKPYPPLGILYLSAVLKGAGHEVQLFDGTFRTPSEFRKDLSAYKPDLAGIYANVITREVSLDLAKEAKEMKVPFVLGGPDATGDPEAYLKAGALAVVRGEGERTLLDVVSDPEGDLTKIPGLILPGNGEVVHTEARERISDLSELPFPDRDGLDMERYINAWKGRHGYSSISLITSRGCPYNCTWCSKEIFGCTFRQNSPERVLEEVRLIREKYSPDQLWFADDVLTLNKKWIVKLTDAMAEQDLATLFECLARVDRVDGEVLDGLKKAGCFRVWYGAESGSEKMVKAMRKDFTVKKVRASVALTMEKGIEAGLFLLIGYPGEKLADLLKTLKMIRELKAHYCGSSVAFPIKGTPFYEEVRHQLSPDYAWSRRNENRLSFRGRYPAVFYWFAVRLVHNWSSFFSVRNRKASVAKKLLYALKFTVAGAGAVSVGLFYDLKQKLSSKS